MPHNNFDTLNQITFDDIKVALLSNSGIRNNNISEMRDEEISHPSYHDLDTPELDTRQNSNNNNNSNLVNNFESNILNTSFEIEVPQQQLNQNQISEKQQSCKQIKQFFEKNIALHDDLTDRQYPVRDVTIKMLDSENVNFRDILSEIAYRQPSLSFFTEKSRKVMFFIFDPIKQMYIHLPYNHVDGTLLMANFLQNLEFLQIKFREVKTQNSMALNNDNNNASNCYEDENNDNISPAAQKQIYENEITEKYLESLQNIQPMKREKERTIDFAMENVKKWRNYLQKGTMHEGIHIKLNLNQAAQILGIRRKTLDEYYKQIKEGYAKGFDFEQNMANKIGILRKFNKLSSNNNCNNGNNIIDIQQQQEKEAEIQQYQKEEKNYNNNNNEQQQQIEIQKNNNNNNIEENWEINQNEYIQLQQQQLEQYDEDMAMQSQFEQFTEDFSTFQQNINNNIQFQQQQQENSFNNSINQIQQNSFEIQEKSQQQQQDEILSHLENKQEQEEISLIQKIHENNNWDDFEFDDELQQQEQQQQNNIFFELNNNNNIINNNNEQNLFFGGSNNELNYNQQKSFSLEYDDNNNNNNNDLNKSRSNNNSFMIEENFL